MKTVIFAILVFIIAFFTFNSGNVFAFHLFKYTTPKTDTEKEHVISHFESKDPRMRQPDPRFNKKMMKETGKSAFEPKQVSIIDLNMSKAWGFDAKKGEKAIIVYTLPEDSLVSITVLHERTRELFLSTIINYEYRETGTHTEIWDGRDYHGNIVDLSKINYIIKAEAMNTFAPGTMTQGIEYKKGEKDSVTKAVGQKYKVNDQTLPADQQLHLEQFGHIHGTHHEYAEEIPLLTITSIKKGEVIKGMVSVNSVVDKKRRGYGDKFGYGVRYYLDDELLDEEFYEPESDGKFSFLLDTTAFENGEHVLFIGLCDHNNHVTSNGVKIIINN